MNGIKHKEASSLLVQLLWNDRNCGPEMGEEKRSGVDSVRKDVLA